MADARIPEGLSADYANEGAREAINAFLTTPDWERLAELLTALREGYLVTDVTGTQTKKRTHVRTIRSTKGQLLLPLFTSMGELRAAVPKAKAAHVKGAVMPSLEALRLIRSDRFVAVQLNSGPKQLVVLRKFIDCALGDDPIEADLLATLR